jgi:hypothetical protein
MSSSWTVRSTTRTDPDAVVARVQNIAAMAGAGRFGHKGVHGRSRILIDGNILR